MGRTTSTPTCDMSLSDGATGTVIRPVSRSMRGRPAPFRAVRQLLSAEAHQGIALHTLLWGRPDLSVGREH